MCWAFRSVSCLHCSTPKFSIHFSVSCLHCSTPKFSIHFSVSCLHWSTTPKFSIHFTNCLMNVLSNKKKKSKYAESEQVDKRWQPVKIIIRKHAINSWRVYIYHKLVASMNPAHPDRWIFVIRTEKSFPNLIKSNRNQIVFTIFRLIWLEPNRCPIDKYIYFFVLQVFYFDS